MAGFFPLFFKQYWSPGVEATVSTFRLGVAHSAASLAVALAAPLLGAVADRCGNRKAFLGGFAGLGILATALLAAAPRGAWILAASFFGLAVVGFSSANVFYDALLPVVARGREDRVSALGYALGYLGGGLLFAANVAMVLRPAVFGLAGPAQAVKASFLTVALWWALFAVPLFRDVAEPHGGTPLRRAVALGLGELKQTFRHARQLKAPLLFLAAYWLYIDGVHTIIRMAVDYGLSLGLGSRALITALLVTQFVGFPAALVFGRVGERVGSRAGILAGLAVYVGVTVGGYFLKTEAGFFALAAAIGTVQGGVQALSRALYSRLVPAGHEAQFFGFYNMVGKFAAILGPALMGGVGLVTGNPRAGIFAVTGLLVAGGSLLVRVEDKRGPRAP